MFFVCAFTVDGGCELNSPDPSALIIGVKFCDQDTGTNLHTQERTKDLNAPAAHRHFSFLSCSGWRHLSCSGWRCLSCSGWRRLSCSCAYTFLVDVRRSKRTDTKNMA